MIEANPHSAPRRAEVKCEVVLIRIREWLSSTSTGLPMTLSPMNACEIDAL